MTMIGIEPPLVWTPLPLPAATVPPAADGATATAASAAGAGMAVDTDAGAGDAHASGASGADADMAVDMLWRSTWLLIKPLTARPGDVNETMLPSVGLATTNDAGDNGAIAGDATTAAVAEIEEPDEGAWGAATSTTAAAVGGGTRRRK